MTAPELVTPDWEPGFVDYFYLSFTNATAFSPTDTLPLSRWAKMTMMLQSRDLAAHRRAGGGAGGQRPRRSQQHQRGFEPGDQALAATSRGALGEVAAARRAYSASAVRRLDPHRRVAEVGQVVRAGPHVQRPDLAGQRETVADQLAAASAARSLYAHL